MTSLGNEEVDLLRTAFQGLMARWVDDPEGYFQLAGIHWLPRPGLFCRHHENPYNDLLRPDASTFPFPLSQCGDPTVNVRLLLEE